MQRQLRDYEILVIIQTRYDVGLLNCVGGIMMRLQKRYYELQLCGNCAQRDVPEY